MTYYELLLGLLKYAVPSIIFMIFEVGHVFYFKEIFENDYTPTIKYFILDFTLQLFAFVIIVTHGNNYVNNDVVFLMFVATIILIINIICFITSSIILIVRKKKRG